MNDKKNVCLIVPNVFPVPAVNGGACETLVETLIKENEKLNKINITCVSIYDEKAYKKSKEYIINLLDNVNFPLSNPKFNAESISKFINNYKGKELDKWDIVFVSGSSENKNIINGQEIPSNMRSYDLKQEAEENIIRIGGSKARLGNPGDPKFALKDADIEIAKNKFNEYHANSSSMSNKDYFIPEIKRNPLLMIYFVDLKEPSKYTTNVRRNLVGLGIGIPNLTDEETKFAIYKVNKTYFDLGQNDHYGDEE